MTMLTEAVMHNAHWGETFEKVYDKVAAGVVRYGEARAKAELQRLTNFGPNWMGW